MENIKHEQPGGTTSASLSATTTTTTTTTTSATTTATHTTSNNTTSTSDVQPPQLALTHVVSSAPPATTTSTTTAGASTSTITTTTTSAQPAGAAAVSSSSSSSSITRVRPAVFDKLEQLVQDMQDVERGVPVRSQKMFLTSIPAAFMGYDLIEWLMDRLSIEDSLEAVHLANLLCQFGYFFPINELKNLLVKDDSSLYRFQTPYYWPSQHHTPDNIEYAIYLAKRSHRNRQKHGLEDYEVEAYNNLKKILSNKWDFVMMQSEEQLKIAKDRKKGDKIITDSQEKAYWRVYRPPPGYTTVVESSPVPTREQRSKARSRTREHLTEEHVFLKNYIAMSRSKVSQAAESLIEYTETFMEYDPVLSPVCPSNPWVTEDETFWKLNQPIVDVPTEKRVRKWAISLEDLITDPLGIQELLAYMKKEYSHENLRFWLAVQELRRGPCLESIIRKTVKEIWDEFLSPGAKAEINIDGQTMESTKQNMKSPSRFTFEEAAGHIYLLLLKNDCYPRFIRSESYKNLLANALKPRNMKKTFFNFPARKKQSNPVPVQGQGPCIVNQKERMWEDFNIHGAQGQGDNSDSPETNSTFDRNPCVESVCPWDDFGDRGPQQRKSPRGSVGSGGGGSTSGASGGGSNPKPHHRSLASASGVESPCSKSGNPKTSTATRTSSLENSLERGGSCRRRTDRSEEGGSSDKCSDPDHHGSSHHHHHHHHHHHGASRRTKNRSKRKKTSIRSSTLTSAGEVAAAVAAAAQDPTRIRGPPHHQHSASSLFTSMVGPASMLAVATFDRGPASTTTATKPSATPTTAPAGATAEETPSTSSKCTQTKLEDEDELFIPPSPSVGKQSPVKSQQLPEEEEALSVPVASCSEQQLLQQQLHNSTETSSTKKDSFEESQVLKADQKEASCTTTSSGQGPGPGPGPGGGPAEGKDCKPEMGTWASSTEVCPWEDEENRRDSHAPFVKTYATLGFL